MLKLLVFRDLLLFDVPFQNLMFGVHLDDSVGSAFVKRRVFDFVVELESCFDLLVKWRLACVWIID
jgi:hypothetical protein